MTDINALDDVLADVLNDYATDVRDAVNMTTEQVANELKKAISADAPVKTGKQKKSWRVAKEKVAGLDLVAIVHSTDYRKVHLLENCHVTRNGVTRTKAIRYVGKNEEAMERDYPERLAKAIKAVK